MASSSATDVTGGASVRPADHAGGAAPVRLDQPTVISSQPPLPTRDDGLPSERLGTGDRLEHFEIVEFVGGGGMARVYRALDTRLSRTVALKVLSRDQAADPETRQRFINEAQSAAKLDHDNIARVYYCGEDRGLPFIALEYISGTDIRALVERSGPLPLEDAISHTLQVAEALAHASSREVVHRDIKPSNILITPEGQAKLIDMGLARLQRPLAEQADLTASGVTLGTFDYISPEQARDPRVADVRSDIYSLGCAFFYMLVGRPPFPEGTVLQKLLQHQGDEPPDPRLWRPGLPEELIAILRKMLAKDPRLRYQEAGALVAELMVLAELVGVQPAGLGRTVWITPQEHRVSYLERHLPWIAPITALLCIVLLLDFLWSSPQDPEVPFPPDSPQPVAAGSATSSPPGGQAAGPGTHAKPASPREKERPPEVPEPNPGRTPGRTASAPGASTPPEDNPAPSGRARPSDAPERIAATPAASGALPDPAAAVALRAGLEPEPLAAELSSHERFASGAAAGDGPAESRVASVSPGVGATAPGLKRETAPGGRPGVLVVTDEPEGENQFRSLSAACSMATNGDVIELCFDGRREESPVRVPNLALTIRAGQGFRPQIAFRPTADDRDPVKYPRSMLTLTGGELTLFGVVIELDAPREVAAERWTLIEVGRGQEVRVTQSVLSVRNAAEQGGAFHPDVAFFRVRAPLGADTVTAAEDADGTSPAVINLTDSVVRGEATVVCVEDAEPMRVVWDNGLVAVSERLLLASGGQETSMPLGKLQLELRHVTAFLGRGLCRVAGTSVAPYASETEIRCHDSILAIPGTSPLVEQSGPETAEELKRRLLWYGDWNFYEGCRIFWRVESGEEGSPDELMDFAAWQAHWGPQREIMPKLDQVVWKHPLDTTQPAHARVPADYALAELPAENPALGAARDGRDVGLRRDRLPPVAADRAAPAERGDRPEPAAP